MNMREVKANVHRDRITGVVNALYNAGFRHLTVVDVGSRMKTFGSSELSSTGIGRKVNAQPARDKPVPVPNIYV